MRDVRIRVYPLIKFACMNEKIVGIIAVIIVIVGGWFLLSSTPASAPQTATTEEIPVTASTTTTTTTTTTTSSTVTGATVVYTNQGFSPSSVIVPLGTTVTFINQSTGNMWVASAMHPTHIVYSGTSLSQHCPDTTNSAFDECAADAPGSSFSFTFNKEGAWKYHNHVNASQFGTVIVTAAP